MVEASLLVSPVRMVARSAVTGTCSEDAETDGKTVSVEVVEALLPMAQSLRETSLESLVSCRSNSGVVTAATGQFAFLACVVDLFHSCVCTYMYMCVRIYRV